MFSSVVFSVLFALLPLVLAQDSGSESDSYVRGVIDHLKAIGHNEAADVLRRVSDHGNGRQWLLQLQDGNYTVFVPDDGAIRSLPRNVSSDDDLISEYLSYHVVHGDFRSPNSTQSPPVSSSIIPFPISSSTISSASSSGIFAWYKRQDDGSGTPTDPGDSGSASLLSGTYPNVTLGRTLLNSSTFVRLEASESQVLAWTRMNANENVTILNQNNNVTVTNSSTYENLFINTINGVLTPPGNLSTALCSVNATSFLDLSQQTTEPDGSNSTGSNSTVLDALTNARGFTLFVPNDAAFQQAQQIVSQYQNNQTALVAIFGNQVINGTTVYSPDLTNATASGSGANFITAAGETISFSSNTSGLFVQNQNGSSAQIVRPDVLLENGVFHVIDNFLVETDSNPQQAASAFMSASSVASAMSSTDTLPIGGGFATLTSSVSSPSTTSASSTESSASASSTDSSLSSTSTSSSSTDTSTSSTDTAAAVTTTVTQPLRYRLAAASSPKKSPIHLAL